MPHRPEAHHMGVAEALQGTELSGVALSRLGVRGGRDLRAADEHAALDFIGHLGMIPGWDNHVGASRGASPVSVTRHAWGHSSLCGVAAFECFAQSGKITTNKKPNKRLLRAQPVIQRGRSGKKSQWVH